MILLAILYALTGLALWQASRKPGAWASLQVCAAVVFLACSPVVATLGIVDMVANW